MSLVPIHTQRISFNLQGVNLLTSIRRSQVSLLRSQDQIATGLRFQRPSEDVISAGAALRLNRRLDVLREVQTNLRDANAVLTQGESAMHDAVRLLQDAHGIALQMAGDTASPDERRSLATVINSLLEQMVAIGNREHLGTHLFSGHVGGRAPFAFEAGGVVYYGDEGRLQTILDTDLSHDTFTISGAEFFNAFSGEVRGRVDLDPQVTLSTRIADLRGATGNGVTLGRIQVSDGISQVEIDLSDADTVGDVIDRLNADMPGALQAALVNGAIRIGSTVLPPPGITVTDSSGSTATELGIFTNVPVPAVLGGDLNPRLTLRTPLTTLMDGAGVSLTGGIAIRNGPLEATIDFTGAQTVEDVLNRINQAGVGVIARINDQNDTIEVLSRVSGTELTIEEAGGNAAAVLGIRTLDASTPLRALNGGRGVDSVEGDDFRIVTAGGAQIDIDIDALDLDNATVQDLLDLINAVAGGAVTASLASSGGGIVLTDNTAGAGTLRIEKLNLSPAIDTLGLNVAGAGGQIVGRDVNPIRVDSPFTALIELRAALLGDDTREIGFAAERAQRTLGHMLEVQGKLAAQANRMQQRADRVESETTGVRVLLSDVQDSDIAEAVVRFQQVQTALQANLAASSRMFGLTLLNYLR